MKYIESNFQKTLEVKQSKFIAHFVPYKNYTSTLEKLKKEHPKARHFVAAYRYLNEYNQIVEYSTDDGEPKGTSGKPSLMVLQGANIINSAVIVVRYFGGTKLGTGGLVRAYSDAINLVLDSSQLLDYKQEISKKIYFDYTNFRKIEYECKQHKICVVEKIFSDKTVFEIRTDELNMDIFLKKIERLLKRVE